MDGKTSIGAPMRTKITRFGAGLIFGAILAAVAACPASAAGLTRQRITFDEALAVALRQNRPLRVSELESRTARYRVELARGAMLPALDALENYSNANNPTLVFSSLLNQQDFAQNDFALERLNHPASLSNFQSQIRVTQPVFAGGRLWAAFNASRDAAEVARWRARRERQTTAFAVAEAYYGSVLAERRVAVIEQALAAAHAHRAKAENLLAHGMVVKADVLRTGVLAGTLEQQRNDARNRLLTAWDAFAHVLGAEDRPLAPLSRPPELDRPARPPKPALEELIAVAINERPELKAARSEIDRARQALQIARAEYLPSVGVAAAYENDSRALVRAGNSYTVFVTGQVNLFNGFATSAKIAAARTEIARADELRDELTHGVALEVETAYHALLATVENLAVARQNEAYAAEALKILDDRYASGLATNVEVLDAETAHKEAALGLAQAKVAVLLDRYALKLAIGKLEPGEDHD